MKIGTQTSFILKPKPSSRSTCL